MSVYYCQRCEKNIDLDEDVEHMYTCHDCQGELLTDGEIEVGLCESCNRWGKDKN